MKTIAVGNFVGFEVTTIQEVVKAQACGLVIADKYGNDYNYEYEEEGEDGIWTSREPTDKEVFERITRDIADGDTLLAGFWLDTDKVQVVRQAAVTMQSDFHIGQEVYRMENNKIRKDTILSVHLCVSKQGRTNKYILMGAQGKYTDETLIFATKDELIKSLMEG